MSPPLHPRLRPASRAILLLILLAPLGFALPGLLRTMSGPHGMAVGNDGPRTKPSGAAGLPDRLVRARPVLGFAINAHHIADLPRYLESVDRIAALGANALVLVTPWFQPEVNSDAMRLVPRKCPTDRQVVAILRRARERGLYTVLQPIVLIESPGEKDWRGVIRPRNWDSWWAAYDRLIDYHVGLAREAGIDQLCIGSELNTTEEQLDRWRQVVERVRGRFDGVISYSANWDRFDRVELWPLVDIMSVSSYFELARDNPEASVDELVRAWEPRRDTLIAFARQWNRPLLLSEVGYPSLPWAAAHPWNYVSKDDQPADHEAQARCYRAFFEAWAATVAEPDGPVAGFFCYRWDPYHHGQKSDTGYGIYGKPAAAIVRAGFERIRMLAAPPAR